MACPLRVLLTAVLWQSSDGLHGSGTPKGSTSFAFKVFLGGFLSVPNVSILKDNLHLYLESFGVNRRRLQVGTLAVPSLCLIFCLWYIQKLLGDRELKHMWCFSYTKLCFGRVVICSRLRTGCWSCLRKMQLPESSTATCTCTASPHAHIGVVHPNNSASYFLIFPYTKTLKKVLWGFSGM